MRVWEVRNREGKLIALFLGDYFHRPSKRSGAWMSSFRNQERLDGEVLPIIVNVLNFTKAAPGHPSLLSLDDARTLFHEFGHALHGLLSDVTYGSLSGTNVDRDFVELPSQLFENWLLQPETLRRFARHADTGEPIPEALAARVLAARKFNQGFATAEYTASALYDLDIHEVAAPAGLDASQFEKELARAHRHAGRHRAAPPAAAFPAYVRGQQLCGGLLHLSLGRGHGSRRVLRFRGSGRVFSTRAWLSGCTNMFTRRAAK